jgi:hypothetical protein
MSLLKDIKSGVKCRKLVTFPGTDKQFEFRLISEQDKQNGNFAADSLYKETTIGFHNINDYQSEKTLQQLFRACVEVGTDTPIAANISEFRSLLTGRERDLIVEEYNAFDEEFNPSPDTMSNEDFDMLLCDLKKKPIETVGSCLSLQTLRKLVLYLEKQLRISQTDSGSTSM